MPQVELKAEAPDFTLTDFSGKEFTLSHYRDKKHVLLVLNRGFV